jgi:asparagine synthase (glutamine-hydrolysing)
VHAAAVRSRPFWSYPAPDPAITEREALDAVRTTLDASVRDHLIADVPVGVFLSSGIDSTIVAGLAARHAPGIEAFTIAFGDNADMSEGPAAARTAARFGIPHHDVQITNDASLRGAEPWLRSQDQPSMDGLNVYLVSKAVRDRGIKVALSGQGGDEIFGGYPSFAEVPRIMRAMRRLRSAPPAVRAALGRIVAMRRSPASREKFIDMLLTDGSALQLTLARRRVLTTRYLAMLGQHPGALGLDGSFQHPEALARLPVTDHYPIHSISLAETDFYMGNLLLRDCDANGMAHSLEIRVPLLDQRVLDTFLSVPGSVRLPHGGCDKHLLRSGFPELFSPEILSQSKVGFILPIKRWMAGPMREMCVESLGYLKRTGIVAPEGVDRVWSAFLRDPESVMWSRAWTLVVLGAYAVGTQAQAAEPPEHAARARARRSAPRALEAAMART